MKIVSSATMRALDEATIAAGTPGSVLMERAGRGIAQWIHERTGPATVVLVAGKGNNGGDAFVVARYLQEAGHRIRLFLAGALSDLTGDAAQVADEWHRSGGSTCERPQAEDWHPDVMPWPLADVVVDALLGTGSTGAPRGVIEAAVQWINGARNASAVISVDLPTGVDGDSGAVAGEAVVPDCTLTLGLPKPACLLPERCGSVATIEIGLDAEVVAAADPAHPAGVIDDVCRACVWPAREAHAHKGTFGAVQLVGGSPSYERNR